MWRCVTDEPSNRRILARLLQQLGTPNKSVTIVSDGPQALELMRTAATGAASAPSDDSSPSVPDVVLLDIMMPGMTGLEVMRALPRPLPFPVIAMTGNVDDVSLDAYKAAGFAGHTLHKPFDVAALRNCILGALGEHRAPYQ
jgi:two-component system nitrogen regulation response regulator GlnG